MARTYIFAIGGSGARVLRSLTMLLAAGADGTGFDKEIVPIIIDYDTENGDTVRTQHLLECYQQIHNYIYRSNDHADQVAGQFFGTKVSKIKELATIKDKFGKASKFEVYLDKTETNATFGYHIGYGSLTAENGTLPTRHLLDVLYDNSPEDSPTAELYLNLEKGFKGCPNIGCVITKRLKNSPEINTFLGLVRPEDRILIIGSIFGGTGASGIPMLVDLIREKPALSSNTLGIIAVTPYFSVNRDSKSAIDSDTFTAKTKAALDAYSLGDSVNEKVTAIYYVGDSAPRKAFANHEGKAAQKNEAHIVELVGAMMAIDFMNANLAGHANAFEFGVKDSEVFSEKGFRFNSFYPETLRTFIYPLMRLAMFNQFCKDYWFKTTDGKRNDTWLRNTGLNNANGFKDALKNFIFGAKTAEGVTMEGFDAWVKELEGDKRPFKFINVDAKNWDTIYPDLPTSSRSYGFTSHYLSADDLRGNLAGQWVEVTDNGKKTGFNDRPEYLFIKFVDKVFRDAFKEVLSKNNITL